MKILVNAVIAFNVDSDDALTLKDKIDIARIVTDGLSPTCDKLGIIFFATDVSAMPSGAKVIPLRRKFRE